VDVDDPEAAEDDLGVRFGVGEAEGREGDAEGDGVPLLDLELAEVVSPYALKSGEEDGFGEGLSAEDDKGDGIGGVCVPVGIERGDRVGLELKSSIFVLPELVPGRLCG
jgi:hypothetical protein